ncbi:MAG: glycoside hydrolase family 15 protein, partial [Chthoniobacterales bacterium]
LINSGFLDEARAWREWLLRAVAGNPEQMQIMYGVCGERRLTEFELPWLSGYENSKPVRVGNLASSQFQLDVFGEVMDSMYRAHCAGIKTSKTDWRMQAALIRSLESKWEEPDYGIWEVRGDPQHFTHSKMMAWVAFDRAVKIGEESGFSSPENLERRRAIRDHVHEQVCREGFNEKKQAFTQVYGSEQLDASLLMMPLVGFLPPDDPRVISTVEAIQSELVEEGFVLRYRTEHKVDGLPGDEGVFLLCSFWLADSLHLIGRTEEARKLFERLLTLRNDVGLLAEEYDPRAKRQLGNFPQAFSHIALVNTARILSGKQKEI